MNPIPPEAGDSGGKSTFVLACAVLPTTVHPHRRYGVYQIGEV
jgi:hypothetical protein